MSFNFSGTNQSSGPSSSSNPFGAAKPPTTLFGGGTGAAPTTPGIIFGKANEASAPASGGNLFASTPTTAHTSADATKPSPFGGFGAPSATTGTSTSLFGAPATSTTSTATPAPSSNVTSGLFSQSKSGDPSAQTNAKAPFPSFFGQPSTTPSSTTPAPPAAPSTNLFGLGKPTDSTSTSALGSTSNPSTNLFGGGGLFGKPLAPSAPSTTATKEGAPTTTPGLHLLAFSELNAELSLGPTTSALFAKPADKKDAPAAPAASTIPSINSDKPKDSAAPSVTLVTPASATAANSTMSTTIAVPPPSMLRGKTIEEIVNRWSTELETHVRDFNKFAGEVAVWDRALIDNGKNLAALFSHVTAVEREQNEIEQSLDHIEQQQKDLSTTLDSYEKVMQDVLGGQGGSPRALDTGPADTERDKNYMLATDLHTQLDDLSGSLTQMIESVNSLSLSNNSKDGSAAEDPMSQISQILSSHLESLQWIDGAVKEVESKVTEVEKRVKDSGISLTGASSSTTKSRSFGLR